MTLPDVLPDADLKVIRSALGGHVHFIGLVNPGDDPDDPLSPKACQIAMVTEVGDEPRRLGLTVFASTSILLRPLADGGAEYDHVSLPKIERGPSGRTVGTWHFPGCCG